MVAAIPVVLLGLAVGRRGVRFGGELTGAGVGWAIALLYGGSRCAALSSSTDGCVGPDLGAYVAIAVVALATGALISAVTLARDSSRHVPTA